MSVLFQQLCDVYEVIPGTQGRLGSESRQLRLVLEAMPCTYFVETERAVNTTSAELVQIETSKLFIPPRAALTEQMVIKNIRERSDVVVAAGPFVIEKFDGRASPGHSLHHRLAQLKVDLSLPKEQV